ncbi:hypothetical protein AB1Y20_000849 [Prymnesium parvum]|uniref:EF-hand domain-containing protein n=1 Tax=Prymnesium parvum TaxID=97485 RepID=A0AB34KAX5_PRYPA
MGRGRGVVAAVAQRAETVTAVMMNSSHFISAAAHSHVAATLRAVSCTSAVLAVCTAAKAQKTLAHHRDHLWPVGDPQANPRKAKSDRPFSGLVADFRLRQPTYWADWRAGVCVKTVGATLFLYFACLAPVVAFGGALQVATQGQLGIVETILSRGMCGMVYAALAGQPMTFIGPTGLTLTFTTALYSFTSPRGIPFLPMYAWVGLWTSMFLILAAVVNLAVLIRYCTRFTEEVFNSFLGTTYLWTAAKALSSDLKAAARAAAAGAAHAASASASALFAVLLGLSTFSLCEWSSAIATSRYGSPAMRSLVADFGPAAAVAMVSAVSMAPFSRLLAEVPRLALPAAGALERSLLVPFWTLSVKYRLLAIIPAFFLAMLFFLDQNITVRTVNSPANKLQPRATYHLDLFVLGLLTGCTSILGLPWMCAATVESINHIRSMTEYADSSPRREAAAEGSNALINLLEPQFRAQFDRADVDGNGFLSAEEVVAILRAPDRDGKQMPSDQAARQAAEVLRQYDLSGDGRLQFEEFASWRATVRSKAPAAAPSSGGEVETVVETRLSGFLVHAMVLSTLTFVSRLKVVPVAVVHGVFFYLGKKVMIGNQFLERLRALAVPLPTNLDTESESERSLLVLGRPSVFMFTGLQLACLATLWALKLTPGLGMVFPAAIGILMFIRAQLLPRLFTRRQLSVVDTPIWSIRRRAVTQKS